MVNYQGNLVLLGGKDAGGTRSNLVTAFDGLAWKSWPAMHTGRQWGSYAVFNSAIFAIGGLTTTRDSTSLVEYFTNNTWQSGPSLPVKMRSGAAAVYQDKLFYLGGYDESSGTSATIYTLAQGAKTWGTTISMPQPSLDHGTVLFNNQLYLLGGNIRNSGTMSNQVWRLEGSSWQEMPAMQQARGIAGMVVFEDRLLVAGGTTSYHPKAGQKTVEAFDGIRWTFQQPLVAGVFDTQIGVL
jgi:N-acetylneuraminic acid mutarotase